MANILPINVLDLLFSRGVESARIEFKASWDPHTTGSQVLRTICAFANDLQNLNGGYIVIGVEEADGTTKLPPAGISVVEIENAQKWIRGNCNRIDPIYQPILSPEVADDRHILVIWAPGSDSRPHQAPETSTSGAQRRYYVRLGAETVAASGPILTQLLDLTAKTPFDDRRAGSVDVDRLREARVREFLSDIGSDLVRERDAREVYRRMRIVTAVNGYEVPRNVGLLLFSDDPEEWFRGARIDVVQFADAPGNLIEERSFKGSLHYQLRNAIDYLRGFSTQHLQKMGDRPEVKGWVSYPLSALEEALVNAVYHRSYDGVPEPTKVYLYPDRIEVISYPGPVPGINHSHLEPDSNVPPVPARNRRIGEILKELRLAEARGTGIPKIYRSMKENGSPKPEFDFDDGRTYFRVTLPAHPEYLAINALRAAAHLRAIGSTDAALQKLLAAFEDQPASAAITVGLINELASRGDVDAAGGVFERYWNSSRSGTGRPLPGVSQVVTAFSNVLLNAGQTDLAKEILNRLPVLLSTQEAIEAAIAERRAGRQERAHRFFEMAGSAVANDVKALHEFAQTKIRLANDGSSSRRRFSFTRETRRKLLTEAREILERVLQMDAPPARHAWAWFDLGRVLRWLKAPQSEVRHAFERALALNPDEKRFLEALNNVSTEQR